MTLSLRRAICTRCVQDSVLRQEIKDAGTRRKCQVCGGRRIGVSLQWLADRFDAVYRTHFDEAMTHQSGAYPEEIAQELSGCDFGVAAWLVEHLAAEEVYDITKGGTPAYDGTTRYAALETEPYYLHQIWTNFEEEIKYQRRFFGADGVRLLQELLGDLPEVIDRFGLRSHLTRDRSAPGGPPFGHGDGVAIRICHGELHGPA